MWPLLVFRSEVFLNSSSIDKNAIRDVLLRFTTEGKGRFLRGALSRVARLLFTRRRLRFLSSYSHKQQLLLVP